MKRTRTSVPAFGLAVTLGVLALGTTVGPARALSNPALPVLTLDHTITSQPWDGSTGSTNKALDLEGSAYVPSDDSLWVSDDSGDRIFEIDRTTGALKRKLVGTDFQGKGQLGAPATLSDSTRTDDFGSIAYDGTHDVLYIFSGSCCTAGPIIQPPYNPTAFRLARDASGDFQIGSWQPLPEAQDPTAAGYRPGSGLYFGHGTKIKTYDFATNTVGPNITVTVGAPIVGMTFLDATTMFVTTSDTNNHALDRVVRVSTSNWAAVPNWTFDLRTPTPSNGPQDLRSVEIIGDTFYVLDGFDGYASTDTNRYRIFVYQLGSLPAPAISVGDASVVEGASGARSLRFAVSLSAASWSDATVRYVTGFGTATAGSDYTAVSGAVTIPAGSTSTALSVPVRGDTSVEAKETFGVWLSFPAGATLGRAGAVGRILNDDVSSGLRVAVGDATVVEGTSGTRSLRLTVSLSAASASAVSVSYATAGGTATSGTDFVSKSGWVTIPAGSTSTSVAFAVRGDTTVETDEKFTVKLSNPVGAVIGRTTGNATIVRDDT